MLAVGTAASSDTDSMRSCRLSILMVLFATQPAMPTMASDDAGDAVSDASKAAGDAADDGEATSDSEAASEDNESVQRTTESVQSTR
jgi:hypothetical protein